MAGIRLDRLCKRFGEVVAIDDISIEFCDGQLTSVLGPSGCGKTTTLNTIAGFVDPDRGSICFGEQVIADAATGFTVPPNKRNLGMVFQSYALWPHLSVAENVAYGLKMRNVPRAERDEAVIKSLRRVKLEHCCDRFPHELSGGQQQRVALARAIAYSPPIVLFDEPLSNLDAQLREEMRLELKEIHRDLGVTAIYVTHDQAEAMSLSDRIVIMWAGRILQCGSPRELYEEPADIRVATFLGRTNVFEARLVEYDASRGRVSITGVAQPIQCRATSSAQPNTTGVLSVRPEAVAVKPAGATSAGILGHVSSALYLGKLSQLQIRLDCGKTIEVVEFTRRTWNVGDTVEVAFDSEQCFFIAQGI
jgi:ABC-type Fe3+/spermidine/putrescine transport system ATPase subunit